MLSVRMVFMASENKAPDACMDPKFHEGLEALQVLLRAWRPLHAAYMLQLCLARLTPTRKLGNTCQSTCSRA